MKWEPIDTAPKDGSLVLCCWLGGEGGVSLLCWKTNFRLERDRRRDNLTDEDRRWLDQRVDSYFGDPLESDDYHLAEPANFPTHWLPLPEIPK